MIRKSLYFIVIVSLLVALVGCSSGGSTFQNVRLIPNEDESISDAEAERVIKMIQNYAQEEGTIKSTWDELTGTTGKVEWQAFRPEGYDSPDVYYVQMDFEKSVNGEDYQMTIQWFLDLEASSMRDFYYEVNGVLSDKLSFVSIMRTMRENP